MAQFNVYLLLVNSVFPIVFSSYAGAWGDRLGRKVHIYIFMVARVLSQAVLVVCAYYLNSQKEYLLFVGLPIALAGKKPEFNFEKNYQITENYRGNGCLVLGNARFHF